MKVSAKSFPHTNSSGLDSDKTFFEVEISEISYEVKTYLRYQQLFCLCPLSVANFPPPIE
ncbi:hypothetical protein NQ314_011717 [Rhamnusium bicolor]|uniref:Uncharacterized protein n=1 Tax=Rhamnusium bicolor TaxID=1586634 RepID=A0AAV8XGC0_9CUCU|nr:hypothetical protein NQ314_011717 [Rhamnusium bicolor]